MKRTLGFLFFVCGLVLACGSSHVGFADGGTDADGGGPGFGMNGDAGARDPVAHLQGKVFAPEGTLPISGALIYLSNAAPPAIPSGVYCDRCVLLTPSTPYTYSAADGTFNLPAYGTGMQYVIVQKGQFRRVRQVNVVAGDQALPATLSTLPGKSDVANGDDIPKMAIVVGQWDRIELTLAKLGLGTIQKGTGIFMPDTVINAAFDMKDASLLSNAVELAKYNIVFVPCSFSSGTTCDTSQPAGDPSVKAALEEFVGRGGKLYTTDYSYEAVRQPFPGYVTWEGETSELGSACQSGSYDAPANMNDKGLGDWLTAIGDTSVSLQQNWTTINSVNPTPGLDVDGKPAMITPKVWVTANKSDGPHPSTISFEHSCGRVLFSTYHTEGDGSAALIPQEKALLYVLLEVSVCIGTPVAK